MTEIQNSKRQILADLFHAAVHAADPTEAMRRHLPPRPRGRVVVIAAGKAATTMAEAFEKLWDGPFNGIAVAPHGHKLRSSNFRLLHAAHPVPDAAGLAATAALFHAVDGLSPDDLVIALISGGASALLPAPISGLNLDDEIAVNRALLASGAPISAMNQVRGAISRIKNGGLAHAARPARVVTLIVSDVPKDDPALVGSGPTIPSLSTPHDALAIIQNYRIALPVKVMDCLESQSNNIKSDPDIADNPHFVIASAALSLEAARKAALERGIQAHILSDAIEGEAREIGRMHAAIAREIEIRERPFTKPVILLSGGETTVTIGGNQSGRGGRNSEFLLSFAIDIEDHKNITALAADTDGIDGSETNAGAFADGSSINRMRHAGGDPRQLLASHDAYSAFALIDDLFITGPTGTNVNDFRAILIE